MKLKDFGMLDEADIKLVVDDEGKQPVWTAGGEWCNQPKPKLLAQAKKVLLVIHAGSNITAKELESILVAYRAITPDDALFLYTITEVDFGKSIELYVKRD